MANESGPTMAKIKHHTLIADPKINPRSSDGADDDTQATLRDAIRATNVSRVARLLGVRNVPLANFLAGGARDGTAYLIRARVQERRAELDALLHKRTA